LVTGASAGIGENNSANISQNNYKIILCVWSRRSIVELKWTFSFTEVHTLSFDVRVKGGFESIESLPETFSKIDVLINNAGNAHGLDSIQNGDLDDWDAMIDYKCKAFVCF
jgi:NADP-dependent 3-hydroxy acid dehydrogenase YdfG